MYKLSITIDRDSGFCFGVIYAVEMAEEVLRRKKKLYCLGDIVHNEMEVERLEQMGLEIITHEELALLHDVPVLIRAHGEPPSTYQVALENNLEIIDASCPVILKLQNRISQSDAKGENILIFGKKDHAEVIGLKAQVKGAVKVFENVKDLDVKTMPSEVTLYSQTTKSKTSFREIVKQLKGEGFKVKAHDTICRQVSNREGELRWFAKQYDRIIFVSGTKSSNGKTLFQACLEENPNTYFVSSLDDLKQDWFSPNDSVGICGATSTPQWLMEDVKTALGRL